MVDEKWRKAFCNTLPGCRKLDRQRMIADYGIPQQMRKYHVEASPSRINSKAAAKAARNPTRCQSGSRRAYGALKAKGWRVEHSPISMKGVAFSADLTEAALSPQMLKDSLRSVLRRGERLSCVYDEEGVHTVQRYLRAGKDH